MMPFRDGKLAEKQFGEENQDFSLDRCLSNIQVIMSNKLRIRERKRNVTSRVFGSEQYNIKRQVEMSIEHHVGDISETS